MCVYTDDVSIQSSKKISTKNNKDQKLAIDIILILIEIEILKQSGKSKIHKSQACFGKTRETEIIRRKNAKINNKTHTFENNSSNVNKFQIEYDIFHVFLLCV